MTPPNILGLTSLHIHTESPLCVSDVSELNHLTPHLETFTATGDAIRISHLAHLCRHPSLTTIAVDVCVLFRVHVHKHVLLHQYAITTTCTAPGCSPVLARGGQHSQQQSGSTCRSTEENTALADM